MTQLNDYIQANGSQLELGGKTYTAEGFASDGDISMGTLRGQRASYTVMLCMNARVAGHPTAEVWSVVSSGGRARTVVTFAVEAGRLRVVR